VGGAVRNRTEVLPTAIYLEISIGRLESAIAISLLMVAAAALMLVLLRVLFGATLFGTGRK
jgi:molybdate transport system permease protein